MDTGNHDIYIEEYKQEFSSESALFNTEMDDFRTIFFTQMNPILLGHLNLSLPL